MLKFFTRLEKTRNFVLLLFAILMVVSLVVFYRPSSNTASASLSQSEETAGKVDGNAITVGELVRTRENMSRMMRGRTEPARTTLDQIITGRIVAVEAERLGLTASDGEVAAKIREDNKPADGKVFDQAIYERNVMEGYGNIAAYEQKVRDDASWSKLYAFLTSAVTVSEQEVLEEFQRKNTKFDVSYVAVNAADLAKTITPTDAELREYFEKNKQTYYISVPQKKIKYVFINTSKIGEKLPITDAELKTEFDNLAPDKKIAGVLGQEIMLRIAKPEFEGEVQTRAAELIQRLKKDEGPVTEEAFAELAKGYSENPVTAPNGGKLRGPVTRDPNKPTDPYQKLLQMKPGDVSEPINFEGRYFILRRGEDVPKTFETAKKELEVSLRNRKAYTIAAELAQKVADSLKQTKDPLKTAQQFAAEANMGAADMVRETDFVKPGDDVPNIGTSPQFEGGIAPLANVGDVGEKTPIKDGFAIPMLAEKKEPRDAEFDDVKAKITDVVKLEKANAQVEEIAKQIASGAAAAGALSAAATAKGMTAKDKKDFILGSPLGEGATAGTSEALENAIYAMKAGEVTKTPIKVGDNWFVVGINSREDAKTEDFATQRSGLMEQMLNRKRGAVFSDYLAAVKQRMEVAGDVVIYQEVLDKVDAQTPPPAAPAMPQGLPPGLSQGLIQGGAPPAQ